MTTNALLKIWESGRQALGLWCTVPSSVTAEFVSRQGPDYVCIDYQHGLIDHSNGIQMMQGITAGGSIPIARVGWNEPARIMAVLDAGAAGVIVPMVNSAAEARAAVAACRFPPDGMRSFGPVRAKDVVGSSDPSDLSDVACIVMVETASGIANMDEIIGTKGVDAVYVGPSDLGLALGLKPNLVADDPRFLDVLKQIKACGDRHSVAVGIHAPNGTTARRYVELGFEMITVATDGALLAQAARAEMTVARGGEPGGSTSIY